MGLNEVLAPFFREGYFFHHIFNVLLITVISTIMCFFIMHVFWRTSARLSPRTCLANYTGLKPHDQTILCTHSFFVLLLGLQLVPYTYFIIVALFGSNFATYLEKYYAVMFAFIFQHGLLYVVEASTRSIIKFNSLLLWYGPGLGPTDTGLDETCVPDYALTAYCE